MMDYKAEYQRWCTYASADDLKIELEKMDENQIEDSFYRNLAFGTGGLRGVIGAGTNRMNVYTVAKASKGVADYLNKTYKTASIVIGYDSRIKSELFAKTAAETFAENGIKVHFWPNLNPVPTVSFAVRYFGAKAGIMITASHNPSKYNGYKVYDHNGCQITTEAATEILFEIEKLDIFNDVKKTEFETAKKSGQISYIGDEVFTAYIDTVKSQSVLFDEKIDKDVSIVYSPLNGSGYLPVTRVLSEMGFKNVVLVKEQCMPDGNFPTCPYPNPEIKEAMSLGIEYAKNNNADILIATDPDCDRVGIAVKNKRGEYVLLSGNETGILLFDFICSQRTKHGKMPKNPLMIKTVVTMDMASKIADDYGVRVIDVLTGFKFIGEQIGFLEEKGKEEDFIFGFEESYGYLTGGYVRDKDGVNGASMICEMFAFYKTLGVNLIDKLDELFNKYGYCLNTLHSYEFEGQQGFIKMQNIMKTFRGKVIKDSEICGIRINEVLDFNEGLNGLPKSDVLKYLLDGFCSIVVRPSGTEPKLKIYISVSSETKEIAGKIEGQIIDKLERYIL